MLDTVSSSLMIFQVLLTFLFGCHACTHRSSMLF
jgi:hypothetical protein